jgi:hypothetical protein
MLSAHDKFISEKDQKFVCRLPAKDYGTLEFDMPSERMEAILRAGEAAMEAFFESIESSNVETTSAVESSIPAPLSPSPAPA